jgi:hypothetical protein
MTSESDTLDPAITSGAPRVAEARPGFGARAAVLTFAAVEAGAFVYYLALGRTQWFFADEWEFLSARGLNVHDLLRAHYGHWVAVPIVVYRMLWELVGLRSYVPYVGLAIVLHLVAAALLRVIMRRAGVRPWTATIVASAFVLFGRGAKDVLWAFQIAFSGALVFGLVHLLLADHDGPVDYRDWLGLAAGLLGLMCSGVAVTMVIVVGIATLLRRSWRIAVLHAVPLGLIYTAWWLRYSHGKYSFVGTARQIVDWSVTGAAGVFGALGSVRGVGWVLAAALVVGGVVAVRRSGIGATRTRLVLPTALLIGAIAFLVIAAFDRSGVGASGARASRYLHIVAALVLPAVAVAIDALFDRWRVVGVVAMAALLVGIPGNVAQARDFARQQRVVADATRHIMLSIPRDPLARSAPRALRPEPNRAPTVTLGWLQSGVASGRVPKTRPSTPKETLGNRLRLSLMELDQRSGQACRPLLAPVVLHLTTGARVGIVGKVAVILLDGARGQSGVVPFGVGMLNPAPGHTLVTVSGPLTIRIARGGPTGSVHPALCTGAAASAASQESGLVATRPA